jgi:hypothetical protein
VTTSGVATNESCINVEPEAVRTDTSLDQLELAARLKQLELDASRLLKRMEAYEEGRIPDLKDVGRPAAVIGMMKGRSYGTFFYGPSSAMSVVARVSAQLFSCVQLAKCSSLGRLIYSQDLHQYFICLAAVCLQVLLVA